jgi:hypothetical protein
MMAKEHVFNYKTPGTGRFIWPSAADGVVAISSAQLCPGSPGEARGKPGVRHCLTLFIEFAAKSDSTSL